VFVDVFRYWQLSGYTVCLMSERERRQSPYACVFVPKSRCGRSESCSRAIVRNRKVELDSRDAHEVDDRV
jgi:hypothetical protein